MASQFQLLKTKRFLPLFITQFFNAFNDNVYKNALVILITYKIASSIADEQMLIAMTGGIFILPFFLFSAIAGQLADKFEKSRIIRWVKFLEIVFMLVGIIGFYFNDLPLMMTTLFFLGCHSTFFGPIKYSLLPEHLQRQELIGGNALIEAGTFIAILIGQILGGSLILLDNGLGLISLALLSIAILGFISSLFIPKSLIGQSDLKLSFNIFKQTFYLINTTRKKKKIFLAILGISWFWFIGATFLTQFPSFTKNNLHSSSFVFTLFLTVFSLGIGVGSLLCNTLFKGKVRTQYVPIAIAGMSLCLLDIFFASGQLTPHYSSLLSLTEFITYPTHIRILADVLVLTVCGGLFVVPLYTFIQEMTEETIRSRIIAVNNIINAFFMVASALFLIIATWAGLTITQLFIILAFVNLGVAFYLRRLNK